MPQILQHRRANTAEISSERGSTGEFWMDESKNTIVVMDGSTLGGHPLAKFSDIPVNVSSLTNDAGYITSAAVFSGSYNDLSDVPATFTPNTHNQDWSTITNTPTTIAGYGITDAPPTYDQDLNTSSNVEFLSVSSSNISTTAIVTNTITGNSSINVVGANANTNGGQVGIAGGIGTNGNGGSVSLSGGIGSGGNGGNLNLTGGIGSNGEGGSAVLIAGIGTTTGGDLTLGGGSGQTTGGDVLLYGGSGAVDGGTVTIIGGSGPNTGGDLRLWGGIGGGTLELKGGSGSGNVTIDGGAGEEGSPQGSVLIGTTEFTESVVIDKATITGNITGSVYANNTVLLVDGENGELNTHTLSQVNAENGQPLLWSTSLARWQPGDFSYNSLTDTPTIPADVGDLTDTGNLLFSGDYGDLTGKLSNSGVAYQYGYSAHNAVSTAGNDFTVDGVTMTVSLTASANAQGARINISGITTNSSAGIGLIYVQRRVNSGSWNVWNSFVVDGGGHHFSHSFVDFYDTGGTSLDANTGDTVEYKLTNGTNDTNYTGNSSGAVDFELFFGFQFTVAEVQLSYSLTQP